LRRPFFFFLLDDSLSPLDLSSFFWSVLEEFFAEASLVGALPVVEGAPADGVAPAAGLLVGGGVPVAGVPVPPVAGLPAVDPASVGGAALSPEPPETVSTETPILPPPPDPMLAAGAAPGLRTSVAAVGSPGGF